MSADPGKGLKIGPLQLANPLLLAPLSGISDLPFRLLAKEQGCALVFTEMISAEGLSRKARATLKLLKSQPEERPFGVQIFGPEPEILAEAAKAVEGWGGDLVDINMGCPVRKVVHGGSGSALLREPARIRKILKAVRKATSLPLTIKIRTGWDEKSKNFLEVGKIAEEAGVDAITIHGRARSQGYAAKADWADIRELKSTLKIPVIGNGDILTPPSILKILSYTGCDGAMIGRGAYGNPWIFAKGLSLLRGEIPREPSLEEKEELLLRHLSLMVDWKGEIHGLREFRKHLIWYTRGFRGSVEFRTRIPQWETLEETAFQIRKFFQKIRSS
ncbi:MAG: tRNA-U20-dihydrouridine synthase, partial [Deltaproteobacteria bacterium]|nr:tRNA-U20-dihydrouridine synthase [Deltaproteobacteria bacterium]